MLTSTNSVVYFSPMHLQFGHRHDNFYENYTFFCSSRVLVIATMSHLCCNVYCLLVFFRCCCFLLSSSTLCPPVDGHRSHLRLSPCSCKSGEVQQLLPGPECLYHGPVSQTDKGSYTVWFFLCLGKVCNLLFLACSTEKFVSCAIEQHPQQTLRWVFSLCSNCNCSATCFQVSTEEQSTHSFVQSSC